MGAWPCYLFTLYYWLQFMSMASFKYASIMFWAAAVAFSVGPCVIWKPALAFRHLKYRAEMICCLLWAGALDRGCDVPWQKDEASAYCFRPRTLIWLNSGILP